MRSSPLLLLFTTATTSAAFSLPFSLPFQKPLSSKMPSPTSDQLITDILPQTRSINIFAGLTRDIDPISDRLDSPNENSTILAPLNSAVQALPHKPWEDEEEIRAFDQQAGGAYGLGDGEQRANNNLRKFVERHIVPLSPWAEKERTKSLAGEQIWWEQRNGDRWIMPADVKVQNVVGKVGNGEVWVLEGVVGRQ